MEITQEVRMFLEKHEIGEKDCLLVALSGGRDSMCLLHILMELRPQMRYQLRATYVHHGLREEADEEAVWLAKSCEDWDVLFSVRKVDVQERVERTKESIEEAARNLRYQALLEESAKWDAWILMAHHAQDQAETVLLRLLRGSGLRGLSGMLEQREKILRPLLRITPEEITDYMKQKNLPYLQDVSNNDIRYTRNWIRHRLLPLLEEKNPAIQRNLCELAEQARQDEAYMENVVDTLFRKAYDGEGLAVPIVLEQPDALQGRLLRRFLQQKGGIHNVGRVHIQMIKDLCRGTGGGESVLPGGRTFYRQYDKLLLKKPQNTSEAYCSELPLDGQWKDTPWGRFRVREIRNPFQNFQQIPDLPYTKWLNCDTITEQLVVRTRNSGDYLGVRGGHQSLKKYMVNAKIPRETRDQVALVASGSHVLWIVGHRLSEAARLTEHVKRVVCIEYDPKEEEENNCRNPEEME